MKKPLKTFLIIMMTIMSIVLIGLPILIYYLYFGDLPIRANSSDWSNFGGFISGTVNTIISLLSAGVLVYITVLVSKNTNQEALRQQILLQRMDSYRAIVNYIPKINLAVKRMPSHIRNFGRSAKNPANDLDVVIHDFRKTLENELFIISEFNEALRQFRITDSHLYTYDFQSEKYDDLLKLSEEFEEEITNILIFDDDLNVTKMQKDSGDQFLKELTTFINELRREINLNKNMLS